MTRLHVPIRLRWSDLDAYGHVNNAEMLRLLEEARIAAFWVTDDADPDGEHGPLAGSTAVLDGRPGADTITLIARQEIEYLRPVPYQRNPLDVQLWFGKIGGSSIEVCYEVFSPASSAGQDLYARASAVVVMVDAATGRPVRLTDEQRAAWSPYLGEPVVYAHRR
ncbi:MAG: thioesterase family protein [Leifsonia sp.]